MCEFLVLFNGQLQFTYYITDFDFKYNILRLSFCQSVSEFDNFITEYLAIAIHNLNGFHKVSQRSVETPCSKQVTDSERCLDITLFSLFENGGNLLIPCRGDLTYNSVESGCVDKFKFVIDGSDDFLSP